MHVTQYYKTIQLTAIEAAMVTVALVRLTDALATQMAGEGLSDLSRTNMAAELAAIESAMLKCSRAQIVAEVKS